MARRYDSRRWSVAYAFPCWNTGTRERRYVVITYTNLATPNTAKLLGTALRLATLERRVCIPTLGYAWEHGNEVIRHRAALHLCNRRYFWIFTLCYNNIALRKRGFGLNCLPAFINSLGECHASSRKMVGQYEFCRRVW